MDLLMSKNFIEANSHKLVAAIPDTDGFPYYLNKEQFGEYPVYGAYYKIDYRGMEHIIFVVGANADRFITIDGLIVGDVNPSLIYTWGYIKDEDIPIYDMFNCKLSRLDVNFKVNNIFEDLPFVALQSAKEFLAGDALTMFNEQKVK